MGIRHALQGELNGIYGIINAGICKYQLDTVNYIL